MTREEALRAVQANVKNKNLVKHMIAAEVCMKALARQLGADEESWGLAGLLHDIDYDSVGMDPVRHSMVGAEMLVGMGVADDITYAVKVHNEAHGLPRVTMMDKALHAVDPLTGLIVAAALIHPAKRLAAIDTDFVMNRFGERHFAKGASREQIARCSELGLELRDFVGACLGAMQAASEELGL